MIPQERNEKSLKPWKDLELQALAQQERFARGTPVPRHAQQGTNAPQGRFLALLAPCSNLPSQKTPPFRVVSFLAQQERFELSVRF